MRILILLLICLGIVWVVRLWVERVDLSDLPFRRKDYLLTRAERSFFDVLCRVVDRDLYIFSKVRLADLVWLPRGVQHRLALFNRVSSKHIDFVLCSRSSLSPVLAIELDDASHQRPDRQTRDHVVDAVLRAAGLPLLRVPTKRGYALAEIRQMVQDALPNPSVDTGARHREQGE